MSSLRRFSSRPMLASAMLAVTAVVLAACSGGGSDSDSGEDASSDTVVQATSTPPAPPGSSGSGSSSGSGAGSGGASSVPSASLPGGSPAALKVGLPKFPDALTDAKGRAVYTFSQEKDGTTMCIGQCAVNWPPVVTTGKPTIVGGDASKVGQQARDDGTTQATYGGWPLYYFFRDTAPGQANGEGINAFGGQFLLINKDTKRVS